MSEEQNIEEQSDKSSLPIENENIPEYNIQPSTLNIQHNEENMEVHHPHHPTHKKKWTEYLLEFLMLFLAVFLGFLAENLREDQVEHQREKQYVQSFIYDLANDTANLNEGFPLKDQRVKAIDSVFLFFEINPDVMKIPGAIYRQMQRTLWVG